LFKAQDTGGAVARLENEMALAHLGTGNIAKAEELAASSMERVARGQDDRQRAHVLDTQSQIQLAKRNWTEAKRLADEAFQLAIEVENGPAASDALLSLARAAAGVAAESGASADLATARAAFDRALKDAREAGRGQAIKKVLTEYADFLAANGDHKAAFELSREALSTSR
jgi:tetratricopeptide (TPR) repeat protein